METINTSSRPSTSASSSRSYALNLDENPKIARFLAWLRENGAVFDMIELASFDGGLMGVSAKRDIGQYKAFLSIPNTCIISVTRVKNTEGINQVLKDHP
jgi:hypothetical protein